MKEGRKEGREEGREEETWVAWAMDKANVMVKGR